MSPRIVLVIYLCSVWVIPMSSADYYTSQNALHELISYENEITEALHNHVLKLEDQLQLAKRYLNDYEEGVLTPQSSWLNSKANAEFNTTLSNINSSASQVSSGFNLAVVITEHPLLTYKLIRRFAVDLVQLESAMKKENDFLLRLEETRAGRNFPTNDDLNGATQALIRIQESYKLDIDKFSKGIFDGIETNYGLTARDMCDIGLYVYNSNTTIASAVEWLVAAQNLSTKETPPTISISEVTEKVVKAIAMHNSIQTTFTSNSSKSTKVDIFQEKIEYDLSNWESRQRILAVENRKLYLKESTINDRSNFAALCRGDNLRFPNMTKDLNCWYDSRGSAFLLDPMKAEMHHRDPPIIQYYDVLSDSIISKILEKTSSQLERSMVRKKANESVISPQRTSTTAWIMENKQNDVIAKLPRHFERITGLNVTAYDSAEQLQVTSYGIGGHYNPHYDSLFTAEILPQLSAESIRKGDRISTVLFYLSEVKAGGGTAFPKLGVHAKPVKGSAIFWDNLKRNGDKDLLSLHGGCPILYGKKIVANKWIRYNRQTMRTCSLLQDE